MIPVRGTKAVFAGARYPAHDSPPRGGEPSVACTVHQGPYEEIRHVWAALLGWVENNGYRIAGPDREIYLVGYEQVPVSRDC